MALSRQLSAVLGGHVHLVEENGAAGFAIEIPLMSDKAIPVDGSDHHDRAASH
jgi:hypothetical protein